MKKYFYNWYSLPNGEQERLSFLNYLGEKGWQLVHITVYDALMCKEYDV
jgi:hypothetical protein